MNRKLKKYVNTLSPLCFVGYYALYNSHFHPSYSKRTARKQLNRFGIADNRTANEKLEWFLTKGNRHEFTALNSKLLLLSESETEELLAKEGNDALIEKLITVKKYMHRLNENSIGALDLSYMLLLTEQALITGFLSKQEAIAYQIRAVRLAQSMYSSWSEYLTACTAGAEFVSNSTSDQEKYMNYQKNILIKLMASKHSPFRKIDFNMSFS